MDTASDAADGGACGDCGGRIVATHMLTKSYRLDPRGRWQRRVEEFAEDVIVACERCGVEAAGRIDAGEETFVLVREGHPPDRGST